MCYDAVKYTVCGLPFPSLSSGPYTLQGWSIMHLHLKLNSAASSSSLTPADLTSSFDPVDKSPARSEFPSTFSVPPLVLLVKTAQFNENFSASTIAFLSRKKRMLNIFFSDVIRQQLKNNRAEQERIIARGFITIITMNDCGFISSQSCREISALHLLFRDETL